MLNRLEKHLGRFVIENLTIYLVFLVGAFSALKAFVIPGLGVISAGTILRGEWWNIIIYPFCLNVGMFTLLFILYMLWIFGTSLEEHMGAFKYNFFILFGMLFITLGTLLTPLVIPAYFVFESIFIAIAFISPNMEILLFFILPIRIKWLALIAVGFIFYNTLIAVTNTGSALPLLYPILGLGNFIIFFGREMLQNIGMLTRSKIRKQKHVRSEHSMHKCTICDITEHDDPVMDFRFCVECDDHEYCMKHLNDHLHIKTI